MIYNNNTLTNNQIQSFSYWVSKKDDFFPNLKIILAKFGIIINIPSKGSTPFIRPEIHIIFDIKMMKYFNKMQLSFRDVPVEKFASKEVLWREIDPYASRIQLVDNKDRYLELQLKDNIQQILLNEARAQKLNVIIPQFQNGTSNQSVDYYKIINFKIATKKEIDKFYNSSYTIAKKARKAIPSPAFHSDKVGLEFMPEIYTVQHSGLIKYLESRHFRNLLKSSNCASREGYVEVFVRKTAHLHVPYITSFIPFRIRHENWGLGYLNVNIKDFIFFECLYENDHTKFRGWMKK